MMTCHELKKICEEALVAGEEVSTEGRKGFDFICQLYKMHYEVYKRMVNYLPDDWLVKFLLYMGEKEPLNNFTGLAYLLEIVTDKMMLSIAQKRQCLVSFKVDHKLNDLEEPHKSALNILRYAENAEGLQRLIELMFGIKSIARNPILQYSVTLFDNCIRIQMSHCSNLEFLLRVIELDTWAKNQGVNAWRCFMAKAHGEKTFVDYDTIWMPQDNSSIIVHHRSRCCTV